MYSRRMPRENGVGWRKYEENIQIQIKSVLRLGAGKIYSAEKIHKVNDLIASSSTIGTNALVKIECA